MCRFVNLFIVLAVLAASSSASSGSNERNSGENHSGEHHSGEHHSEEHHSEENHSGEQHSEEHHSEEHHSSEHHSEEHSCKCPEHEVYNECGSGCGDPSCDFLDRILACKAACKPGCFCEDGYVRDENAVCVLKESCPVKCPGKNEKYSNCVKGCGDGSCRDPTNATKRCTADCKKGCFCEEGYVRENGVCIAVNECPQRKCKANETYNECGPFRTCERTCDNPTAAGIPCPRICVKGCFCSPGYVKNELGVCTLLAKCPPKIVCKAFEQYEKCYNPCPPTCDKPKQPPCPTLRCSPGCACQAGYIRDENNRCILQRECPVKCPANESYNECGPQQSCVGTCQNPYAYGKSCTEKCVKGCFCNAGFVRNQSGKCVLITECKPECGKDQEYSSCSSVCPGYLTCLQPEERLCKAPCKAGCICKKGFLWNSSGQCVKKEKCYPQCSGDNEEYKICGSACGDGSCLDPNNSLKKCAAVCREGCYCKAGHVRENGKCIPVDKCPKAQCSGQNEEYTTCGSGCGDAQCSDSDNPRRICPDVCREGCFCKKGYARDNGKCILREKCPSKACKANQQYSQCTSTCINTCENPFSNVCSKRACQAGCECKPGFTSNAAGECIKPENCPENTKCKANQKFSQCTSTCVNTCENPFSNVCSKRACQAGCECKPGFTSNAAGECIKPENCPKIPKCKANEQFSQCTSTCVNTCENPFSNVCSKRACQAGCECKPGFTSNAAGECIKPENCPENTKCKANQKFSQCTSTCVNTCENPFSNVCSKRACQAGCECKPGFTSNAAGECIKPENCPENTKCKANQKFSQCANVCPGTCANPKPRICPKVMCRPGCSCLPGYLLDASGACVKPDSCPKPVCPANESYNTCGPHKACVGTCKNPFATGPCPDSCQQGCFCNDGYVRNAKGTCVKTSECTNAECDASEEYSQCGTPCPSTCDNPAEIFCKAKCGPGCFCKKGLVRNAANKCVEVKECPVKCASATEEINNCFNPTCEPSCSEPNGKECINKRCLTGCACKKGLLRNAENKCVKKEECPVKCSLNEEYNACRRGCGDASCRDPTNATVRCTGDCKTGCFCKAGYVREDGKCILVEKCPNAQCSGQNEEYTTCGSGCGDAKCSDSEDSRRICPAVCRKGCFCKKGFARDNSGKCVLRSRCPKDCKANQQFSQCANVCPGTCETPKPRVCPLRPCGPGCECWPGFLLNSAGACVKPQSCPQVPKCKPNEQYEKCYLPCPATCADRKPAPCATLVCSPGCACKAGYIRNAAGVCILVDSCPKPQVCAAGEVAVQCANPCQPTCLLPNRKPCPTLRCSPGCACKPGYIRDATGKCIVLQKCPAASKDCTRVNEVFSSCGSACGDFDCATFGKSRICTKNCQPGCFCKPNFVRNENNQCVPASSCSKLIAAQDA